MSFGSFFLCTGFHCLYHLHWSKVASYEIKQMPQNQLEKFGGDEYTVCEACVIIYPCIAEDLWVHPPLNLYFLAFQELSHTPSKLHVK